MASTDANLGRPSRVQGQLDPNTTAVKLYLVVSATDDHLRIEALKLVLECFDGDGLHLGVRAQNPKDSCNRLPVGSIVILEGNQYAYVCSYPIGTNVARVTAEYGATIGHPAHLSTL